MKKILLMEVKQALRDQRFRDSLGPEFKDDIHQFLKNPGCACNTNIYRRILKEGAAQLLAYYPGREVGDIEEEVKRLAENHWSVINCAIHELQKKLEQLGPGRKMIAVARWQDQVTVVVNHLDVLY